MKLSDKWQNVACGKWTLKVAGTEAVVQGEGHGFSVQVLGWRTTRKTIEGAKEAAEAMLRMHLESYVREAGGTVTWEDGA